GDVWEGPPGPLGFFARMEPCSLRGTLRLKLGAVDAVSGHGPAISIALIMAGTPDDNFNASHYHSFCTPRLPYGSVLATGRTAGRNIDRIARCDLLGIGVDGQQQEHAGNQCGPHSVLLLWFGCQDAVLKGGATQAAGG